VEPWQGQMKPPGQLGSTPDSAPVLNLSVGEQPRWVQMPTATKISGLIERVSFLAYSGCMFLSDFGSASWSPILAIASSISLVRLMIHTGLPRHSTVII